MGISVLRSLVSSRRLSRIAALIVAACASPAFAFNVYTVGGDSGCGYTNIQDAINAAAQSPGEDYIFVAQNLTYSSQVLVVNNDDVIIEGGFPNCGVFENGTNTTLLSGTSGHSIFEIEGDSHVALWNFEMTGANLRSDQKGGAIYFGGSGNLSLMNDWIHDNTAGYGGALAVNPSAPTQVMMNQNLIIGPNTALVQGGAIHIEGQTTVTSSWSTGQPPIYIGGNVALGQGDLASGGGIEVVGPASFNGAARIHDNIADYGAGISIFAHDNDGATVNLYTTDPNIPVQVANNRAGQVGGGIYVKSASSGAPAAICMQDFSLSGNIAPNGSAIYADTNSGIGSVVDINGAYSCTPAVGAFVCAAGVDCNDISDNLSENGGGAGTTGAAISIQSGGELSAQRFAARRNEGGSVIEFVADISGSTFAQDYVDLYDCLLADNVASGSPGYLIYGHGGQTATMLELRNCTVANNQIAGGTVIDADVGHAVINDSIIAQPGKQTLNDPGAPGNLSALYVLTNDTTTLSSGTGIESGAPTFVNVAGQDYHLVRTSLGVDYAPSQTGIDLDGVTRTVDLTDIANNYGPMDLGAYEIQTQLPPNSCSAADTIFCNGFEASN